MSTQPKAEVSGIKFHYEPSNEKETIILFGALMPYLGKALRDLGFPASEYRLEEYSDAFPDCTLHTDVGDIEVEFETYSSRFRTHLVKNTQDLDKCQLIVCWKKDTFDPSIERFKILELEKVVSKLKKEGVLEIIVDGPKPRPGTCSFEEFMDDLKKNFQTRSPAEYECLKAFIEKVTRMENENLLRVRTKLGAPGAWLDIGTVNDPYQGRSYQLTVFAKGYAEIGYYNVNAPKPFPPIMEPEKIDKIRILLAETKSWHKIKASSTADLVDKLRKIIAILIGPRPP